MNKTLLNNRPKDATPEEFSKVWENASYTLQPLYDMLMDMASKDDQIKSSDFDCPNHYAKLAYQGGCKDRTLYILSLFPEGCKK